MSAKSNNTGRGFEYAIIEAFLQEIQKIRCVHVRKDNHFFTAKAAWSNLDLQTKTNLKKSAIAAVPAIFDFEPRILESDGDTLELLIQGDSEGKKGDVRDILIIRQGIDWEIGLSIKHNNLAVKHSRLGKKLDFGESWYGEKCSPQYWKDVNPIFDHLLEAQQEGLEWNQLADKGGTVYRPLLKAFMKEIAYSSQKNQHVARRMVEYLLGKYDFYKVVGVDEKQCTQILVFNMHGELGKNGETVKPKQKASRVPLPTKILYMGMKENSNTTVELCMDEGWSFTFRIHNASTKIETSLKFDIKIIGMPASLVCVSRKWK